MWIDMRILSHIYVSNKMQGTMFLKKKIKSLSKTQFFFLDVSRALVEQSRFPLIIVSDIERHKVL